MVEPTYVSLFQIHLYKLKCIITVLFACLAWYAEQTEGHVAIMLS